MIQLLVDRVFSDGGTIAVGRGIDVETGDIITFGGDWRPMLELHYGIEAEGPQDVAIEPWQILTRTEG